MRLLWVAAERRFRARHHFPSPFVCAAVFGRARLRGPAEIDDLAVFVEQQEASARRVANVLEVGQLVLRDHTRAQTDDRLNECTSLRLSADSERA
eukprot:541760-Pleurochrysis_carterae.AAC.4